MKVKKTFQKIICTAIILSFLIVPLSLTSPKKAEAESISSYISSLTPIITKMPGCKKVIGSGISDLFSSIKKIFSKGGKKENKTTGGSSGSSGGTDVLNVFDQNSADLKAQMDTAMGKLQKTQDNMDNNKNCLDGIGKAIAKVLVTKLSDSIVNWIQTGNAGDPMFVQDQGAYFKDIAKDQIMEFKNELSDGTKFPFAKDFMKIRAASYQNKFANNAEYSLDTMLQDSGYSAAGFQGDFSQGGWDAWDAMTQNPANNPLGFSLMAATELDRRIEEETQMAEGSLQMSGGFLGVERCIDPKGVTLEEHKAATRELAKASGTGPTKNRVCNKWETVTPGKLVGDQIISTVQKKDNALMDVETLNDAMAAILDAVLAKFMSSIEDPLKGLAGTDSSNPYETNSSSGFGGFATEGDFTTTEINDSAFLADHPDFDIRKDLNQALIDEQRIYVNKLKEQNLLIINDAGASINGSPINYNYSGLIPTIYQLDYCIPGPAPDWKDRAQEALAAKQDKITSVDYKSMTEDTGFQLLDSLSLGALSTVVSFVNGFAFGCNGDDAAVAGAKAYYSEIKRLTTGAPVGEGELFAFDKSPSLCTSAGFVSVTDKIEQDYEKNMDKVYALKYLPSSAKEAQTLYNKIPDYYKTKKINENTIDTLTGIIRRLQQVKSEIDMLGDQLAEGKLSLDSYEKQLVPWKNAFARISAQMYSGDDIASIDKLSKQFQSETDYALNNLIKSPTGCEEELSSGVTELYNYNENTISILGQYKRPAYPAPHLYDYENAVYPSQTGTWNKTGYLYNVLFWDSAAAGSNPENASPSDQCKPNIASGDNMFKCDSTIPGHTNHCALGVIDLGGLLASRKPCFGPYAGEWEKFLGVY